MRAFVFTVTKRSGIVEVPVKGHSVVDARAEARRQHPGALAVESASRKAAT